MEKVLQTINSFLWGIPVLVLIITVGIYLTFRSGFAQVKLLPVAAKQFLLSLKQPSRNGTSGYRALCTALAATVGTGNIAGVAGAIAIGGPGVVFWMWFCALLGMATKLAEVTLAIHLRVKDKSGRFMGGPMYMIERGLPKHLQWMAYLYCFFGVVAAFGVGNATQMNALIQSTKFAVNLFHFELAENGTCMIALLIAVLVIVAFWKGDDRIGAFAESLVPFASICYITLALGVLIVQRSMILTAIKSIIIGAFSPKAVTCGVIGSIFLPLRVGASRGVFTNEAGMGTASIAHAAADVSHPADQGIMGIVEVFIDTILICTLTALVILCSGVYIPYGTDPGIMLTMNAFSSVYGDWSKLILMVLVGIFAFATILGWGLYGIKCAQYIFGEKAWRVFTFAQAAVIVLSSLMETSVIWVVSEIVNGLMAIPNLISLVSLSPTFISIIKNYPHNKKAYSLQ